MWFLCPRLLSRDEQQQFSGPNKIQSLLRAIAESQPTTQVDHERPDNQHSRIHRTGKTSASGVRGRFERPFLSVVERKRRKRKREKTGSDVD